MEMAISANRMTPKRKWRLMEVFGVGLDVGAGSWGTTLSQHLDAKGYRVDLWVSRRTSAGPCVKT